MPEEQLGAVYGSGDGTLALIDYQGEKTSTANISGLNGLSSSVFITRNGSYVFAASQTSTVFTVVNQARRLIYGSQPSRRVPRQREPGRLCCAGICPELQLRLLPPPALDRAIDRFLRRAVHLAQSRRRLRAAEGALVVPVPDAKSRPHRRNRQLLRRSSHLRPPRQGCLLSGREHRLHPELRPGMRRIHGVHLCCPGCAADLSSGTAVRLAAL